jgi:hypothetical protein
MTASNSAPETCHPRVLRDKNFERIGYDRLCLGLSDTCPSHATDVRMALL